MKNYQTFLRQSSYNNHLHDSVKDENMYTIDKIKQKPL